MSKYILVSFLICITACSKTNFLNTKPDPSLVVPSTISDYQAILDNDVNMNGEYGYGVVPELGETGSDNYYLTQENYSDYLKPLYQRCYVWAQNVFTNEQIVDWNIPYQTIYFANLALDGLKNMSPTPAEQTAYDNAKGSALFYRAHMFYQLAQVFAAHYSKDSAASTPGIPLRLTSNINEKLTRASLQETYNIITGDLRKAVPLLPNKPLYATRPSKPACYGLLARIYQTMQLYDSALFYANACLQIKNTLMDYNTIDSSNEFPFTVFNDEDIFQCEMIGGPDIVPVNPYISFADSSLYKSYSYSDLRKTLFFKPSNDDHFFTGSYSGGSQLFGGIATDEIYLIRAECEARQNQLQAALNDLNLLLIKRYISGTFIQHTQANTPDILNAVLIERRKELCFRSLRWTDLRRLNKEGRNITLIRSINSQQYTLLPNDARYVYPIPGPVISFNPGMIQNIR